MLASKYLQDRNYSARAWSKISGLNTAEINQNELLFLQAVDWKLHISESTFQRWTDIVLKYTPGAGGFPTVDGESWQTVIPKLTPDLENTDVEPLSPVSSFGSDLGLVADSPSPGSSVSACDLPHAHDPPPLPSRNLPSFLEPSSRTDNALPAVPAMPQPPMLPTPQMTPRSSNTTPTPAASAGWFPRRPSMCAAMSQAQDMGVARSIVDQRPPPFCSRGGSADGYPAVRQSSLARSTSLTSSPESMVSDVSTLSSRSSRSSSTSSSASGSCVPAQSRLAVQATLRRGNNTLKENQKSLTIASPIDEISRPGMSTSPEAHIPTGQMPDFSNFSLETPSVSNSSAHEAAQSLCALSGAASRPPSVANDAPQSRTGRKRGRNGSEDLALQNHVRHLINLSAKESALPVGNPASSHLLPQLGRSQSANKLENRPPGAPVDLSGPGGMKRACCGSEARKIALNPSVRIQSLR